MDVRATLIMSCSVLRKMPVSQEFLIHGYQRKHLVLLQAAACTYRLPSQPASLKANQQNSEIRRDKETKSHFLSRLEAKCW